MFELTNLLKMLNTASSFNIYEVVETNMVQHIGLSVLNKYYYLVVLLFRPQTDCVDIIDIKKYSACLLTGLRRGKQLER